MRTSSMKIIAGLVIPGALAGPALAQPVISIDGVCSQQMTFQWDRADPFAQAALCWGRNEGRFTWPGFPCTGVEFGISGTPTLLKVFRTGPQGRGRFSAQAAPHLCGGYLQVLIIDTCTLSNVVQIPQ